jgi:hypothetical protein
MMLCGFGGSANVPGLPVFMCGHQPEQIAVGFSLQGLCAGVEFTQARDGKDAQAVAATPMPALGPEAVFDFQFVERGQGHSVSAVKVAENFKDLGFELVVGMKLLGGVGVCSFMNSHGLPASSRSTAVRARSVFMHRTWPVG